MTTANSRNPDHIIERPRLMARLGDGGSFRVWVFSAPAGYGKTTLARQWTKSRPGPVVWYRTTRASGDVALLAVQLDNLLATIAPELPREAGKVVSIASVNPSPKPLARAIVQTFGTLTQDVLLVVDEWEAAGTSEAEEFLAMLVEGLDIRFLITTRTRPDWFTSRLEMYGEGLELGVDELAMTDEESAQVLSAVGGVGGRARLMRSAAGWPAVLGLAALRGEVDLSSSRPLSRTLYDYLASELLAAAARETETALMLLAVASVTYDKLARSILGENADAMIADAVARGLLVLTDRRSLSIHPLMRELLLRRFDEADADTREALLTRCRTLIGDRRWDEALCVTEAARDAAFATEAISAALDDLLEAGRSSSLQRWIAAARAAGAEGGLIDYAESEALLRADDLDRAMALAVQATGSLAGDLAARAHLVASRSAHLTDRLEPSQGHADSAAALAHNQATREQALWLRFLAGLEAEAPDLQQRLDDFKRNAQPSIASSFRATAGALAIAEIEGGIETALDDARMALSLAKEGVDPIAYTGLLAPYGAILAHTGDYEKSLEETQALIEVAESCGIEFPLHYAQLHRASALTGIRKFGQAGRTLTTLERQTQQYPGSYFRNHLSIQRARLYASLGDLKRALDTLSLGPAEHGNKSGTGEFLGWQALLHAAANDPARAQAAALEARRVSRRTAPTKTLSLLAEATLALTANNEIAALEHITEAIDHRVWDPFIIAVRAAPALGPFIAAQTEWRGLLQRLLVASADNSLASSLGLEVPRAAKRNVKLSPRESEVNELIAQGLTNEEIARLLHISLSTAKVHVKHIFEKLGVRSRVEAARAVPDEV
jgi:LuxR family maltose regulon positive regulatory protein